MNMGSSVSIQADQWYCIELHIIKGTAGVFEGWIRDTGSIEQKWSYQNVDLGSEPITSVELMSAINVNPVSEAVQWIDEFAIADQRIGCDPIPPRSVPSVEGLDQIAATNAVQDAGLVVTLSQVHHPTVPIGKVVSQNPSPGGQATTGSAINLRISAGLPPSPSASDGGACFIATAAYGSAQAPEVTILRNFRDTYLRPYRAGQTFIELYYRLSPSLARIVADSPALRAVIRRILIPIVWLADMTLKNPSIILILTFTGSSLTAILLISLIPKHRSR